MTTVYTRTTTAAGASNQNAPLTSAQVDANFINLNADKAPLTGEGTSGTWGISITGNAATATNVAYSGLTGAVPTWNQNTTGNAATATNVAYSGLTGAVPTWNQNTTGNAATATNVAWTGITGKPAVIAAGADAAAARAAIGAGTSSLGLGTTAGTALAGNTVVLPDAPSDGKTYGRKDAAWAEAAPVANPTFTGTVNGITKAMVGLGNVDDTSDANKPISTATQTALNAKASLASPALTGTPTAPTAAAGTNTTQLATTAHVFAERAATTTLTNKTLTTPVLTGTREVRVAMPANAIDLSTGNVFTKTISGATTLTVSNTPTTGNAASFILELTNAGSAAITWFSGVKWAGGTAPTLTTAGVDVLGFYSHDGGTTWRGMVLAKDSK